MVGNVDDEVGRLTESNSLVGDDICVPTVYERDDRFDGELGCPDKFFKGEVEDRQLVDQTFHLPVLSKWEIRPQGGDVFR